MQREDKKLTTFPVPCSNAIRRLGIWGREGPQAALHLHLFRPQPGCPKPRPSPKPQEPKPQAQTRPTNNKSRFAGNSFQLGKCSKAKSPFSQAFPGPWPKIAILSFLQASDLSRGDISPPGHQRRASKPKPARTWSSHPAWAARGASRLPAVRTTPVSAPMAAAGPAPPLRRLPSLAK